MITTKFGGVTLMGEPFHSVSVHMSCSLSQLAAMNLRKAASKLAPAPRLVSA